MLSAVASRSLNSSLTTASEEPINLIYLSYTLDPVWQIANPYTDGKRHVVTLVFDKAEKKQQSELKMARLLEVILELTIVEFIQNFQNDFLGS